MTHGSTQHAPERFLSPSPDRFEPMIKKSSLTRLIKATSKKLKKETDSRKRYMLEGMIKDLKQLKEQL